jgi:hypothetical protein
LLSGDGELRRLAQAANVPMRGVLWVIDLLVQESVLGVPALVAGLEALASHPRCRLSKAEIASRIAACRKGKT